MEQGGVGVATIGKGFPWKQQRRTQLDKRLIWKFTAPVQAAPRPQNYFTDLDDNATLKAVEQKYCTACGMSLISTGALSAVKVCWGRGGFGAAFFSPRSLYSWNAPLRGQAV